MLNKQERIEGLKIKAIPRSCGTQIKGKHFGMNHTPLQKKDAQGKSVVDKEGKPVFEQKLNGRGEPMFDLADNPIFVTKAVADEMFVDNESFVWAITNKKAVSACDYDVKFSAEEKTFLILEKKKA